MRANKPSFFDLVRSFQERASRWQSGDLMEFSALQEALATLVSHRGLKALEAHQGDLLLGLQATFWDLMEPVKDEAWKQRLASLALEGDQGATPAPVGLAGPVPPNPPPALGYPDDYFDHIIEDQGMLGQLCDEVKEHMDIAQFTLVDLEYDSTNPETLNKIFRAFHTIKSSAAFLGLKNLEESAHAIEDLMVLVRDQAIPVDKDLINVIFFGVGFLKDLVGVIEACGFQKPAMIESFRKIDIYPAIQVFKKIQSSYRVKKIGQILQDEGFLDSTAVTSVLQQQSKTNRKFGEIAVEQNYLSEEDLRASLHKQGRSAKRTSFVKVSNERLNSLIDIVGELVVNQSMLRQFLRDPDTTREAGERSFTQLESITTNIKNLVLSMGMVPIAEIFQKLRVVIRNTANETGKSVHVEFHGEETELDRNVIESVYDPLVHMVRNAVDHGLEDPLERTAAGKALVGVISVVAEHKGNSIEITVSDDGRGINKAGVLSRAVSQGLITEAQSAGMGDKDLYALLMVPGFSTKDTVTEVSGRGVGMDVVKQNVDLIHGKVDVRSEWGRGSQFTLRIPLTLAIIDGFVTQVDDTKYIFPFNLVEQIIVPELDTLTVLDDGQSLLFERGVYIPIVVAAEVFEHAPRRRDRMVVVVIIYEGKQYGIAVDAVLGKQEIVIKTLNEALENMRTFSGGTIFGDGTIGFVIDIEQFIVVAQDKGKGRRE